MTQTIDETQASEIIDAYYNNIAQSYYNKTCRDPRSRIVQAMRDAVNGVLSKPLQPVEAGTKPTCDD